MKGMKFSFRISLAAVGLILLLYFLRHHYQSHYSAENRRAFHLRNKDVLRNASSPTWHKSLPYRRNPRRTVRPIMATARPVRAQSVNHLLTAKHESSADIRTLEILRSIDREHQFGSRQASPAPPSFEELASGHQLKVIVVPHSHSDPGWHKTVDGYFEDQTKPTLDSMLEKLQKYPNMTFVWAESVFLSMWWDLLDTEKQNAVQHLLKKGQLEIVSGGWVVPDEANPHYFALIDQMLEGHQWLINNVGVLPSSTWSLDPFGYSEVLAHLHKLAGFDSMVILRVHTAVKNYLQTHGSLEFLWRSAYNSTQSTEMLTLLMPYMLYSIKHSCGPDQDVCLRFDFRKIYGEVNEGRAEKVHNGNVGHLSKLLLRQYQLKASLFWHNVVLVPLGDDFRYDRAIEWDQQYQNYARLFDYMNSKPEWNVHARFGTVKDYFDEVKNTVAKLSARRQSRGKFLSLTGDFFPYTDQNEEFWTGYFTTRPFAKGMSRDLEVFLRSAEILHSLAVGTDKSGMYQGSVNFDKLVTSRRHLALFQHHDAITGTSRIWVAEDSQMRLERGLFLTRDVIRSASSFLLSRTGPSMQAIKVLEPLSARMLSPHEHVIHTSRAGIRLQIFNNVVHRRHELVHLTVNNPAVLVLNHKGRPVASQITLPVIVSTDEEMDIYTLSFVADLPPLSIVSFSILPAEKSTVGRSQTAIIANYTVSRAAKEPGITVESTLLKGTFSLRTGLLQTLELKRQHRVVHTSLQFLMYNARRSGAYIFAPDGPAQEYADALPPFLQVISGTVFTEVRLVRPFIIHWSRFVHCDCPLGSAIELNNIVDLTQLDDRELILRLSSDLRSQNVFYTDQNGFQMTKRYRFSTFPIEANYYPATAAVMLDDEQVRISLLLSQPHGTSSQTDGSLELMLDRRLQYDDNRGLGEGILDNRPVFLRYYLLVEPVAVKQPRHNLPMPSLLAHTLIHRLRNQPVLMLSPLSDRHQQPAMLLQTDFSCDTILVNFRTLNNQSRTAALIVHRVGHNDGMELNSLLECNVHVQPPTFSSVLSGFTFRHIIQKTLSLLHNIKRKHLDDVLDIKPLELLTFHVHF